MRGGKGAGRQEAQLVSLLICLGMSVVLESRSEIYQILNGKSPMLVQRLFYTVKKHQKRTEEENLEHLPLYFLL